MPVLFVGHGSPMNAIEDNGFSRNWSRVAGQLPRPEAILSVSAHWTTDGTRTMDEIYPKTIYDMYGFPEELYRVVYRAKGAPELARLTKSLIGRNVEIDNSWGIDHGTWSVLNNMYPKADIPVYQLSIDNNASAEEHFRIGREISSLREKGVMLLGSGNVVHNLSRINWGMEGGYPWAEEFDGYIKEKITGRQFHDVVNYKSAGSASKLAFFTTEHFYPLLYVLGASGEADRLTVFNDSCIMGSLSMTCYLFE
ncbi:MAG TPA: 4,5-DOPA dioxygenase extradiol [Clostridia bacterium]|nr:4,5-DOPA dioxygenase extradiol [Clostridia bacterium]